MKDLIIPSAAENGINLAEISNYFPGIIIAYKNSKPTGYIIYSGGWRFQNQLEDEDPLVYEDNLLDLINGLIKDKYCTNFKIIEFEHYTNC